MLRADLGDGLEIEAEAGIGRDQHFDTSPPSSRASTARWMLPPDRLPIRADGDGGRTPIALDQIARPGGGRRRR